MTFELALQYLKDGMKIKRKDWEGYWFISDIDIPFTYIDNGVNDGQEYLQDSKSWIILYDKGNYCPAIFYQGDILADDWMVIS
jgi:hypothetical protein